MLNPIFTVAVDSASTLPISGVPSHSARRGRRAAFTAAAGAILLALSANADDPWLNDIDYDDLVQRLGGFQNTPTGASIGAAQVEVLDGGGYGPNQNDPELVGMTYFPMSGPPGGGQHATAVAYYYYGKSVSCAPGVTQAWLYEAENWILGAYLRVTFGSASPPLVPPPLVRLFNNSWVASAGTFNNESLRRADFAIRRDNTLHFNGMNNGGGQYVPLMAASFNGVSVGRADGVHVFGPTPAGTDGPGRQKPDMVAPLSFTSFATPLVSGAATLLLDAVNLDPELALNPSADHSAVIKAVLMGGTWHREGWSNNPAASGPTRGVTATPLDPVYGTDVLNINRSHLILTAGEFDGQASVAAAPEIPEAGWDLASVGSGGSRWYRFTLNAPAEHLSVLATWHRVVANNFLSFTLANFDLRLWRLDASGAPQSLVGDAGLGLFESGNVVSQSVLDNVEHLFVRNLQPGSYAIELDRIDASALGVDVALAWIRPEDPGPPPVFGDLDGDGVVDGADLGLLLVYFGTAEPLADLNDDGVVDGSDLGLLLVAWTP